MLTECYIKILMKIRNTTNNPLNGNGLVQLIGVGNSICLNGLINGTSQHTVLGHYWPTSKTQFDILNHYWANSDPLLNIRGSSNKE